MASVSGRFRQDSQTLLSALLQGWGISSEVFTAPTHSLQRQPRHPITPEILQVLLESWARWPPNRQYDVSKLWAACCTAYFGFMRAGEFTCPSLQSFTPRMLCPADVSVDSHQVSTMVSIHLRHSKTDQFGNGVCIHLGRTGQAICPVAAILGYLVRRGHRDLVHYFSSRMGVAVQGKVVVPSS